MIRAKLRRITFDDLAGVFDRRKIIDVVRAAFIAHSEGRIVAPAPTHLRFVDGDCHVKCGYDRDSEHFVVKIATGFYQNPVRGLPVNHALQVLFDRETGAPVALFEDAGCLTSWRTAAAAVIAASVSAPDRGLRLGIVGTGHQAGLACEWIPECLTIESISVWGRDPLKAAGLAQAATRASSVPASAVATVEELAARSNLIITTTPAETPILSDQFVLPGTHIVALGADSPGKSEIDPRILGRADYILTDDREQCLNHGDFGVAVRAGSVSAMQSVDLGKVLSGAVPLLRDRSTVGIVDLTGLAAQDAAISSFMLKLVNRR